MLKTALITGASSGLGAALSHVLAEQGVSLILTARNERKLQQVAQELPPSTKWISADLSERQGRQPLIEIIQEKQPDLIINNAGFGLYGPAHTHPLSELEAMVEVNVQALMELSLVGTATLIKAKKTGIILNISSAAAFFPFPTFCVYAATKAFVNAFSQGLDREMQKHGIRVLTVCPGQIDTNFRSRASRNHPQRKKTMTLSAERAARLILEEIKKGKPLSIIDWRTQLLVNMSKLFPKRLVQTFLERSLKDRYE